MSIRPSLARLMFADVQASAAAGSLGRPAPAPRRTAVTRTAVTRTAVTRTLVLDRPAAVAGAPTRRLTPVR